MAIEDGAALLRRCEDDIVRIVGELDAAAVGAEAALHLVWAADLLAIERGAVPTITQA